MKLLQTNRIFDQNFIIKNALYGKQALAFVLPQVGGTIYRNLSDGCVLSSEYTGFIPPALPVPVWSLNRWSVELVEIGQQRDQSQKWPKNLEAVEDKNIHEEEMTN